MLRDDASLLDIYNAGNRIISFAADLTAEELSVDEMRFSAILYQFIIIGEATKRISAKFKADHPEISWKDMAGMRDVLAHQYDKINIKSLRKSIEKSLPEALEKVALLLPQKPLH